MKNGLLIWNTVLTVIAGYLLINHFTAKKQATPVTVVNHAKDSSGNITSTFRIAYFEMDSVENNYQMVKDVQAEIDIKEREYNNGISQLDFHYGKEVENFNRKSSSMTEDEKERATMDLRQLKNQITGQRQELDEDYQRFVMRKRLDLKNAIKDFLAEYNKTWNYSYIIVNEQDLYYFKDTAYNITADVIKGLNEKYKTKNKKG